MWATRSTHDPIDLSFFKFGAAWMFSSICQLCHLGHLCILYFIYELYIWTRRAKRYLLPKLRVLSSSVFRFRIYLFYSSLFSLLLLLPQKQILKLRRISFGLPTNLRYATLVPHQLEEICQVYSGFLLNLLVWIYVVINGLSLIWRHAFFTSWTCL